MKNLNSISTHHWSDSQRSEITAAIYLHYSQNYKSQDPICTGSSRETDLRDIGAIVEYLSLSTAGGSEELFLRFINWLTETFDALGIERGSLLRVLKSTLHHLEHADLATKNPFSLKLVKESIKASLSKKEYGDWETLPEFGSEKANQILDIAWDLFVSIFKAKLPAKLINSPACRADLERHYQFLARGLEMKDAALWDAYVRWNIAFIPVLNHPAIWSIWMISCLKMALKSRLGPVAVEAPTEMLNNAIKLIQWSKDLYTISTPGLPGSGAEKKCAELINSDLEGWAQKACDLNYTLFAWMQGDLVKPLKEKWLQDQIYLVTFLVESIGASSLPLFLNYIGWLQSVLEGIGIGKLPLIRTLATTKSMFIEAMNPEYSQVAAVYLDHGLQYLLGVGQEATEKDENVESSNPLGIISAQYLKFLLEGKRRSASELVMDEVKKGTEIKSIYLEIFQKSQYEIGLMWERNEISVAQEHFCTASTQLIMSQLYPHIFSRAKNGLNVVAASVGSELHELGVRMVADFMEMDGWNTFYLGANTPDEAVMEELISRNAQLLALSATMTSHVSKVKKLISGIREDSRFDSLKIIVGGYPFNQDRWLWNKVGADGYASNADEVNRKALELLKA